MSPLNAPAGTILCALVDLAATGAKSVRIEGLGLVVVQKDEDVFCYVNSCPHIGVPLEIEPDEFISDFGEELVCSTHGALFRIDNGLCIAGPCIDQSLIAVPVTLNDGNVVLS